MKTLLVILALFSYLSCQGAESGGWEGFFTRTDSEKELRATLTITGHKTNNAKVSLRVENRTGVDIEYHGYAKDRPQIFIKEKRDGKWVATSWDWCVTGMERHVVKNQKTTTFEIPVTKRSIQIFTIFRNAKDPKEFSLTKLYERDDG